MKRPKSSIHQKADSQQGLEDSTPLVNQPFQGVSWDKGSEGRVDRVKGQQGLGEETPRNEPAVSSALGQHPWQNLNPRRDEQRKCHGSCLYAGTNGAHPLVFPSFSFPWLVLLRKHLLEAVTLSHQTLEGFVGSLCSPQGEKKEILVLIPSGLP